MSMKYDAGPPQEYIDLFSRLPDYVTDKQLFWYDWGPIFYRGRLDGTARLLCVASDPGPTERIALRILIGDAGQRVQGFLAKLGLTRSYVCLNAFAYGLIPGNPSAATRVLEKPEQTQWRNELFDKVQGQQLQAVVAFGIHAQRAVDLWTQETHLTVVNVPHPTSHDEQRLLEAWHAAIDQLRDLITPDADGDLTLPNYGTAFTEADYVRIPAADLPFGLPSWLGDDARGRASQPPQRNCVVRPHPDDRHTLIWRAPGI